MAPLPAAVPDTDRRWVTRVAPDPYLRFDSCDYSLDPRLVGRRAEVRVSQREVTAVALGTGELACRHGRSFAQDKLERSLGCTCEEAFVVLTGRVVRGLIEDPLGKMPRNVAPGPSV